MNVVVIALGLLGAGVLYAHRDRLWNRDLAALSPVSASAQALDGELRSDLGAPDISNLVLISGLDQESVLQRAEHVSRAARCAGCERRDRWLRQPVTLPAERAAAASAAAEPAGCGHAARSA